MTTRLALLHGFTGVPEHWEGVLAALAPSRAVIPTLVGHGDIGDARPDGFEAEVDRLAGVLRRGSEGDRFHLAGYSLGGRLAVGLLVRHPDLFAGATLIGAQPGLSSGAEREERRTADERWRRMLLDEGIDAFVDAWEKVPLFATQAAVAGDALEAQRRTRLAHDPAGLAESLRVTGLGVMPSYWDALSTVPVPTTLLVGERDDKFRALAGEMAARLPRAVVRVAPGVGHNVLLEAPSTVLHVLDETTGDRP
jgi:2-succinyl-6-hydroxy-2,4-cyclohexadiene-1-carboxylate synthase